MKKLMLGAVVALAAVSAQAEPVWMPGGRVAGIASTAGATPLTGIVVALPWSIAENEPAENCAFFGPEAFYATFNPSSAGGPAILEVIKLAAAQNTQFDVNMETDTCTIIDVSADILYELPE